VQHRSIASYAPRREMMIGASSKVVLALYRALLRSARDLERGAQRPESLASVRFATLAPSLSGSMMASQAQEHFRRNQGETDPDKRLAQVHAGFMALQQVNAAAEKALRRRQARTDRLD
jgi:hypothetical protein